MPRNISRDPFARRNVVRETVRLDSETANTTCAWCGQVKTRPSGHTFLYRYGWDDDQGPRQSSMQTKMFCSRSCERSYNS
jgi:hypothetical protein